MAVATRGAEIHKQPALPTLKPAFLAVLLNMIDAIVFMRMSNARHFSLSISKSSSI